MVSQSVIHRVIFMGSFMGSGLTFLYALLGQTLTILAAIKDPAVIIKILSPWVCLPEPHHEPRPGSTRSYKWPNLPPGFRFSARADTPPLPSSHPHTPQWSDVLARS